MKLKLLSYSVLLLAVISSSTFASDASCKNILGFVGFGVMGTGLVNNAINRAGFEVVGHDRNLANVERAVLGRGDEKLSTAATYSDLVAKLPGPRIVMMMVNDRIVVQNPDGTKKVILPPDSVIDELFPFLEEGDIVIDGGNSHYLDTKRRQERLAQKGAYFLGAGISGGEKGALNGPSIMVGGSRDAWERARPLFEGIAAKFGKTPMVTYIGPEGSGHFTKMVHNGIEYAELQAIADIVHILKAFQFSNEELHSLFTSWARDPRISSYLVEKTAVLFGAKNPDGSSVVDGIADASNQLGTGRFTVQAAQELGVNADIISTAVNARFMSVLKRDRVNLETAFRGSQFKLPENFSYDFKTYLKRIAFSAFVSTRILAFAQGFEILNAASKAFNWNLNLSQIAEIWQAGCILQSPSLPFYRSALAKHPGQSILYDQLIGSTLRENEPALQELVEIATRFRIAIPVISSASQYFLGITSAELPLNVVSGLRKIFGDHWFNYRGPDAEAANKEFDWKALR